MYNTVYYYNDMHNKQYTWMKTQLNICFLHFSFYFFFFGIEKTEKLHRWPVKTLPEITSYF